MASWSLVSAPTRFSISSGSFSSLAAPRRSSSARVSTQSSPVSAPAGSMTTTWVRSGSSARRSRALASCSAFSAISTRLPESERMYADSSALVCG
ncbi:hypothetical protein SFUMM280S_01857 [Streptomyces fumanus]